MATLAQATAGGYERVRMVTEQLAVGKWGNLWYLLDMSAFEEKPSPLGPNDPARWVMVEEAERRVRRGDYR